MARHTNRTPAENSGGRGGGGGGRGGEGNNGGGGGGVEGRLAPPLIHKRSVTEPGTSTQHCNRLRLMSSTPVQHLRSPQPHLETKKGTVPAGRGSVGFKDQQLHPPADRRPTEEQGNRMPRPPSTTQSCSSLPPSQPPPPPPPPPQPLPPPPQLNPPLQSYSWPFCHVFPYNFSNPLSMNPLLTPVGPYLHTLPGPSVPTCSGGGTSLVHYYLPGAPPPQFVNSSWLHQNGLPAEGHTPHGVLGNTLNTVHCILQEMVRSLEVSMSNIKATFGSGESKKLFL